MKFNRALGGGEFAGDLLIQQSGSNERNYFALTRGELFITPAQFFGFSSFFVRCPVPLDGGADSVQQTAAAKGFGQEFYGSGLHRAHRHRDVAMRSNKNDRNVDSRLSQLALQFDAAQSWHAHIEHEARRPFGSRV